MRISSDYICNSESERLFDVYLAQIFNSIPKSFLICQIQYWIKVKANNKEKFKDSFRDGRIWVFNSYAKWQKQLPFLGLSTIRHSLNELERDGILISDNFNKWEHDKTKWYTIDFEKLDEIVSEWYVQNGHTPVRDGHTPMSFADTPYVQNGQSITENTSEGYEPYTPPDTSLLNEYNGFSPEMKSKNRASGNDEPFDYNILRKQIEKACNTLAEDYKRYIDVDDVKYIIEFYYREYENTLHRAHPRLKQDHIINVIDNLISGTDEIDGYDVGDYKEIIKKHFATKYPKGICDYNIVQFMTSETMRNNRYFEVKREQELELDEDELPFA